MCLKTFEAKFQHLMTNEVNRIKSIFSFKEKLMQNFNPFGNMGLTVSSQYFPKIYLLNEAKLQLIIESKISTHYDQWGLY